MSSRIVLGAESQGVLYRNFNNHPLLLFLEFLKFTDKGK